ncbi:hypothetical protein NDU88_000373 [Pleurodeles waltl]|uniref:Uncharacterized protein n=1 Tax=Pleurodeles waltl TaxID=8319 RepID=A0AAV7U4Z2_PLEWA|nr:hypothetical protein NDU88_000373 [Pleurodeles waltl]
MAGSKASQSPPETEQNPSLSKAWMDPGASTSRNTEGVSAHGGRRPRNPSWVNPAPYPGSTEPQPPRAPEVHHLGTAPVPSLVEQELSPATSSGEQDHNLRTPSCLSLNTARRASTTS